MKRKSLLVVLLCLTLALSACATTTNGFIKHDMQVVMQKPFEVLEIYNENLGFFGSHRFDVIKFQLEEAAEVEAFKPVDDFFHENVEKFIEEMHAKGEKAEDINSHDMAHEIMEIAETDGTYRFTEENNEHELYIYSQERNIGYHIIFHE